VSPDASLEACALFACGLSTGLGAAMYRAEVEEGSTCVVFGAGMVGLGAVAGCRLRGAERIVCVDLSEDRLALARQHGATDTWTAAEDVVERIVAEAGGIGVDSFISHRLSLDEVNRGFDLMHDQDGIRSVITF
jgi:S-(hydroxymethyl)glutathione dehydrogenase/alcohol dehydrogenase